MEKYQLIHNLKKVKLVIGNGFDLHCKANSSYQSFFEYLFGNDQLIIKRYNDFSLKVTHFLNFSLSNYRDFWVEYKPFEKRNVWDFYFFIYKQICVDGLVNWCDVENVIKNSLNPNPCHSDFCWENVFNISGEGQRTRLNNPIPTMILASICYVKNKYKKFKTKDEFYKFLLKELKLFEKIFGNFIKEDHYFENLAFGISKRIDGTFIDLSEKTIRELCSIENISSIDSFNFGPVGNDSLDQKLININGDLSNPIFGIDSNSFEPSHPGYIFTKVNRRMELDSLHNEISIDKDFENIIIYGHSLNEADYNYFFSLFDVIDIISLNCKSKIVFAFTIYSIEQEDKIRSDLRLGISNMFLNYAKYKGYHDPCRLLDLLTLSSKVFMFEVSDSPNYIFPQKRFNSHYLSF